MDSSITVTAPTGAAHGTGINLVLDPDLAILGWNADFNLDGWDGFGEIGVHHDEQAGEDADLSLGVEVLGREGTSSARESS